MRRLMAVWPPHPESVAIAAETRQNLPHYFGHTAEAPGEYWILAQPYTERGSQCFRISVCYQWTPAFNPFSEEGSLPLVFGVKTSGCGPSTKVSFCSFLRWFPNSVTWAADPGMHCQGDWLLLRLVPQQHWVRWQRTYPGSYLRLCLHNCSCRVGSKSKVRFIFPFGGVRFSWECFFISELPLRAREDEGIPDWS